MNKKKFTKLLALYLPYLVIGLAATNLGEAWRLAEGKELGDKIVSLIDTLPAAFVNPLPSLHPLDILVGICCGVGLRLAVYLKSKNAKKYRNGMEYGSARWGTPKDIEPFMAPKFEDNIILTKTERLMMSNRPPDPKNARNKNVLVVGGSGSGKTRYFIKPNLLQCTSKSHPVSFVVTDPKGGLIQECGLALLKNGYKIRTMNTINFHKSIQNDLMNNFHRLGVLAKPLDGTERLRLMHGMLNMDGANKFHFNWKNLVPSGLSVKDAIAPTALAFKNSRTFQMGGIFGAVSFLNITASDLSDQLLKDFLDMDSSQIVTMHIQSVDQNKAIKTIKHTITELDRSKIEEQKKAVRAGYDMDVLPSDLATYGRDAKALLKELQSQNERMFLVTFLVLNTGKTEQELETNVFQAVSIAQKHNCELCRLDFQQEQGLMSSLPLADCQIEIQRGLTTSSTAIFVPFTTQELFDNGKESLYYGLNALSNNLIMVDRKKLKNPNGLILGTPGSGKSFSAKREICNAFLVTDDDILVCDPESEYGFLVCLPCAEALFYETVQ